MSMILRWNCKISPIPVSESEHDGRSWEIRMWQGLHGWPGIYSCSCCKTMLLVIWFLYLNLTPKLRKLPQIIKENHQYFLVFCLFLFAGNNASRACSARDIFDKELDLLGIYDMMQHLISRHFQCCVCCKHSKSQIRHF